MKSTKKPKKFIKKEGEEYYNVRCQTCGKIIKAVSFNKKYCFECKVKKKKEYHHKDFLNTNYKVYTEDELEEYFSDHFDDVDKFDYLMKFLEGVESNISLKEVSKKGTQLIIKIKIR